MRGKVGDVLVQGARISFLIHIAVAAALYGLTREEGIQAFNWSMGGTVCVWFFGCAIRGEWPRIGLLLPFLIASILILGWFVTFCSLWDPATGESPSESEWLSDFALRVATFDWGLSMAAMIRTGVLLGSLLLITDLFTDAKWTRALLLSVGLTAIGMVAFFFAQKVAPDIFELRGIDGQTPLSFATYRYWGNAASFLNLMWPALAGVALQMALVQGKGWSLWLGGALLVFAALYVNLSKAGQILGLLGLVGFAAIGVTFLARNSREIFRRISWRIVLAAAIPIIILLVALPFAMPWDRWHQMLGRGLEQNERTLAYHYFLQLLPDAGWTGFGPGTFQLVYLQYFSEVPVMQTTPFWVAHEDYLQTIVEWGYVGAAIWGLILVPPAVSLLAGVARRPARSRFPESPGYEFSWLDRFAGYFEAIPDAKAPLVQGGAFVAIGLTALHATVDFPMQIASLQFYFLIWIGLGWRALLDRPRSGKSANR